MISFQEHISNQRGQSLIQALISLGIMGIIMLTMMSMFASQNNEVKSLKEKLAESDFQQQLIRSFADGTVCTSLLKGLTFDSTNALPGSSNQPVITLPAPSLPISTIPSAPPLATSGRALSPISNSLLAAPAPTFQVLKIVGSSSGGTGSFNAIFQVNIDQSKLVRSLVPPSVQIAIQTTAAGTSQTISSCSASTSHGVTDLGYQVVTASCNDPANSLPNANVIPTPQEGICGVLCPAGKVAVGGGGWVGDGYLSLNMMGHITTSPVWTPSQKGWVVAGAGPVSGPWSCPGNNSCRVVINVWAICENP